MRLTGKGSMKQRDLIVVTYPNNVTSNGKAVFLDVQADSRGLSKEEAQTNLHFRSEKVEVNGKTMYNNGVAYSIGQFDKIKEAAGDNTVTLESGAMIYGITADVMVPQGKDGSKNHLIINTGGEMSKSEHVVDENILSVQNEYIKSVKEAKEAEGKTSEETEKKDVEVPTTEVEASEVSMEK